MFKYVEFGDFLSIAPHRVAFETHSVNQLSMMRNHKIGYSYLDTTRKYPLRGYFLGVLMHTTALDRLWGGDETLNTYFGFASLRVF